MIRRTRRLALLILVGLALVLGASLGIARQRAEAEADRRWGLVQARGGLRVGIDPSDRLFSYFTAEGWQGFDADLSRELARRLGLQLWVEPVGYDGFYDALRVDRIDVAISARAADPAQSTDIAFSVAVDTAGNVAFSASYFEAGLTLVSRCDSPRDTPTCLRRTRLAVALGGGADRLARRWVAATAGLERVPVANDIDALKALEDSADAALVDPVAAWSALRARDADPSHKTFVVEPNGFVIAVRRDDAVTLSRVNAALAAMRTDGTLDRLAEKWLGGGRASR